MTTPWTNAANSNHPHGEPMTNPHQQKLYYWICMTNQTSPQLFRLQQAALRPAPPCTKSRASMSADEATGPSASTPGESFYSDWALIGQDGRTIGHASTPGASTPGDSTPGALPPPPPARPPPLPFGASTPGASTPGRPDGDDVESSDANPASRSMTSEQPVKLVLARPSGTVIHRFEEVPYDSVEDFVQRMEEGYIIGVPRCAVSEEGQRARPASCEMTVQCHAGACFDAPVVLRREGSACTEGIAPAHI